MSEEVGYMHCSCSNCFELYVGSRGDVCSECEDMGCSFGNENCEGYWDDDRE